MARRTHAVAMFALLSSCLLSAAISSDIEDHVYYFEIQEFSPPNTYVGRIPTRPGFSYQFSEPCEEFVLDPFTGVITTGKVSTRHDRQDSYNLTVVAMADDGSPPSSMPAIPVTIQILQKRLRNTSPPRFSRLFSANISENAPRGTFVVQVTTSDRDTADKESATYADVTYSFIGASEAFEIEPHTGKVFLIGDLDREAREEYLLMVAANDSSWRAQTTLTINVLDENDNAPHFEKAVYEFERAATAFRENLVVGQVRAHDSDKAENGLFEYALKNGSEFFAINARTGEVLVKSDHALTKLTSANELAKQRHVLIAEATDKGHIPLSGEATVVVTFISEEELVSSRASRAVRIPVPTDLRNDTILFDLGTEMSWRALDERGDRLLYVMGGKIVFQGEGLVQPAAEYNYEFRAVNDELNVTIALVIVSPNAFAPKFAQPQSQIVVAENQPQTTDPLMQIIATDNDPDEYNNDVTFAYKLLEWKWNERAIDYYTEQLGYEWHKALANPHTKAKLTVQELIGHLNTTEGRRVLDPFRLDRERGSLYLAAPLDYELIEMYRLQVTASDGAWFDAKNSTSIVTVIVSDVNDNRPIFTNLLELQKGMEVFENNPIGHIVGEVHALDFDSQPYSQITFEIEPVYDYHNFSISARTGQIQALVSFDFEQQSEYSIKVAAKNNNEMKRSTLVKINVKDINELDGRFADPMSVCNFMV